MLVKNLFLVAIGAGSVSATWNFPGMFYSLPNRSGKETSY